VTVAGDNGGGNAAPTLVEQLREGVPQFMLCVRSSRTTDVVRIAAATGHTCVMVDLEHSAMTVDTATQLCACAGDLGLHTLVRVPEGDTGVIGRLLDGGAEGIIAPRVETAEEAGRFARACRFPPRGHRSQLAMVPQLGMRPTRAIELNAALDLRATLKILIESPAGVANAEEIAAVDGVDIVGIGANDLTAELGVPGRYAEPVVREAIEHVIRAAAAHDKPVMIGGIADLDLLGTYIADRACPLFMTGTDADLLYTAAAARRQRFADWHRSLGGERS
jgi:2-keto-3-deoxy-L-rhamnonate aldolase RhmA